MVVAGVAAIATVGGVGAAVAATGSDSSAGLTAAFSAQNWGTGYEAKYTVANPTKSTISGWKVTFALPGSATMGSFWEAVITKSGDKYVAASKDYNAALAPGASTTFGFIVTGSGVPTGCTINGAACSTGTGGSNGGGQATGTPTATDPATTVPATPPATGSAPGSKPPAATTKPPAGTATAAPPATSTGGIVAPYVDMGSWPTPDLKNITSAGGLKGLTLGFVTGAGCKASWFGSYDPRSKWAKDQIDAVRSAGGTVIVSFGGATGIELAQGCGDVSSLAAEYSAVIDAYGLTAIDLDIEGAASADSASIQRRSSALAQVQKAHPGLRISFTLPVLPEGLTADGVNVVRSAIGAGISVGAVNVMAMDYYRSGSYGDFALQAAQATFNQLKGLYSGVSDAQLWRMVGVTPMLGQNDDGHVFDQAAARQLVAFAKDKHLGMLGFWEVGRDAGACNGALYKCTNISQQPYEFSHIFAGFTG